jgi:effector-binding domain-containing protein
MDYDIAIKELPAQRVVAVRATTTMDKVGQALQSGWRQLFGSLGASAMTPSGPPFAIYYSYGGESGEVELEACLPTTGEVVASPPITVRDEPAVSVAATLHKGPYDGVGAAYEALQAWMAAQGRQIAGPPREVYLTDPQQVTDPADYLTEVQWPVA